MAAQVLEANERGGVDLSAAHFSLFVAAEGGHLEVVKALIDAGANVDLAEDDGRTPLLTAAQSGRLTVAKALIGARATVSRSSRSGVPLARNFATGSSAGSRTKLVESAPSRRRTRGRGCKSAQRAAAASWR